MPCRLPFDGATSKEKSREDNALDREDKPSLGGRLQPLVAGVLAFALLLAGLWPISSWIRQRGLADLANRSGHVLTLVVETLHGELAKYKSTPFLLAHNPRMTRIVTGVASQEEVAAANAELSRLAQVTDASDIYLMNTTGTTIATSNFDLPRSFMGQNFSYRPYFIEAMKGRLGQYFALGTTSGERGYYFAHPIFEGRYVVGVAVVKIQVGKIEAAWRASDHEIMVVDDDGVVFLSSQPGWVMRTLAPLSDEVRARIAEHRRYDGHTLLGLDMDLGKAEAGIGTLVKLATPSPTPSAGETLAERAGRTVARAQPAKLPYLMQSRAMADAGWTVHIFARTAAVTRQTNTALALILATLTALGLAAFALYQRRRRVSERMQLQASINAELERRVAERTDALTRANLLLEEEVSERRRAERELRQTQSDLVQASKLAALGQMSAGLSHELNQPLAAIRSYAENARKFLARERFDTADANLGLIGDLTERMARIIRHLRTFARKEPTTVRPTLVARAIEDSLALLQRKISDAGAHVSLDIADHSMLAIAGEVRLQQVIVNLVCNALDAVKDGPMRNIDITAREEDGAIVIIVSDSGPGIAQEDLANVFDPFFTTKDVGEGLGLGLSISYGIVQQFGGEIVARNHNAGGAAFEIRLRSALTATETAA
ncbi:MAG: sensor histidine kinase [Hyphomicrobiaceae bacterium]|nr:sensor histidine kinase [Hyphomicrobiaceae bacterium]